MSPLSYILAIEPDPRQANALTRVAKDRVGADLTVVDTKDAAIASINRRLPDLILVTALFSPRDEEDLVAHLRTLSGAEHLQTLTIPLLAAPPTGEDSPKRRLFGRKKKGADAIETQGCDPVVFAEQISGYLKTAAELKAAAEIEREFAARQPRPEPAPVAQTAFEPVASTTTDSSFTTPLPQQPLVGYAAETLGELLSKEESIDPYAPVAPLQADSSVVSAAPVESAPPVIEARDQPAPEPAKFTKVRSSLFERPKRIISEEPKHGESGPAAAMADAPLIIDNVPMVGAEEAAPIAAVETAPVAAPEPAPVHVKEPAAPVRAKEVAAPARVEEPPAKEPAAPARKEAPAPVRLVQRLPTLAMWARFQSAAAESPASEARTPAATDNGDPMGVINVPAAIATISYPTGCRIWRVIAKPVPA